MSIYDQELQELRAQKDQLKLEVNVKPILVSHAIQDLISFMEENRHDDKILSGFANKKENPYEDKGGCIIM